MARKVASLAPAHTPHERPVPDPGTPCQTCQEAAVEMGMDEDGGCPEAVAYWLGSDQNPDPDARLYCITPVCDFHMKFWAALSMEHEAKKPPMEELDLYGAPDRTPDDLLTLEGLVVLMSNSLNEELDKKVEALPRRKQHRKMTFHDTDMIRHALQWTRNDMLIMGAWATVMKAMFEDGSYSAAGPEDVVPNDRRGRS
jgi:hypothetical protein